MPRTEKKKVVVVGGGTGTHTLLRGLKRYSDQLDISAIVTMADSGGSTGRLRDEFGQLPVGDARMALAALSADVDAHDELLRELFLYRFSRGAGLSGHNFGNLLLTALTDILGSEVAAIETASRILRVRGQVIPVTTDNIHLCAEYDDGTRVVGENLIDEPSASRYAARIRALSITPAASINPVAEKALAAADVIVLGPGDLYTSILANCVVPGVKETIKRSPAALIYVSNLMSRNGQTIGMHASHYISEITDYAGRTPDHVLINNTPFPEELLARYAKAGDHPVLFDLDADERCLCLDLLASEIVENEAGDMVKRSLIRHSSDKLAAAILSIAS